MEFDSWLTYSARLDHGLRHQDYARYRKYCTRKIERLRQSLQLQQKSTKKNYEQKKIDIEKVKQDARTLEILLFETERSWAYHMDLKYDTTTVPRKKHHALKRLKKAVEHAVEFYQVSLNLLETNLHTPSDHVNNKNDSMDLDNDVADKENTDKANIPSFSFSKENLHLIKAYMLSMKGHLASERQEWKLATEHYLASKQIYNQLMSSTDSTGAAVLSLQQSTLCHAAIESLEPQIRYSSYNHKLVNGDQVDMSELIEFRESVQQDEVTINQINSLLAKSKSLTSGTTTTANNNVSDMSAHFEWRKQSLFIRNPKLQDLILTAQVMVSKLNDKSPDQKENIDINIDENVNVDDINNRISKLDKVIAAYLEAIQVCFKEVQECQAAFEKIDSSQAEENLKMTQLVHAYLTYVYTAYLIERNVLLIRQASLTKNSSSKAVRQDTVNTDNITKKATNNNKRSTNIKNNNDIVLASDQLAPEDIVKLYAKIVEAIVSCKALPALSQDLLVQNVLDAKLSYYQCLKTLEMTDLYCSIHKYSIATNLISKANDYLTTCQNETERLFMISQKKNAKEKMPAEDIQFVLKFKNVKLVDLSSKLKQVQVKLRVSAVLNQNQSTKEDQRLVVEEMEHVVKGIEALDISSGPSLIDQFPVGLYQLPVIETNRDKFDPELVLPNTDTKSNKGSDRLELKNKNTVPNLVDMPPKMFVVPAKPFMYDTAGSQIDYPLMNIQRRIENKTRLSVLQDTNDNVQNQQQQQQGGSGLMGFVSGLWGSK